MFTKSFVANSLLVALLSAFVAMAGIAQWSGSRVIYDLNKPVKIIESLSNGVVGRSYDHGVVATGGMSEDYQIKFHQGMKPEWMAPGLRMEANGYLHGTPSKVGKYRLVVYATERQSGKMSPVVGLEYTIFPRVAHPLKGEAQIKEVLAFCETGDILLSAGGPLGDFFKKLGSQSFTHGGIFDKKRFDAGEEYCILSASNLVQGVESKANLHPAGIQFGKVGYESISRWGSENKVGIFRVKGFTREMGKAAVKYAEQFVGRPFTFGGGIDDLSTFYCTKVVYHAWKSQGVIFPTDKHREFVVAGKWERYCSPDHIWLDPKVEVVSGNR